MISLFNRVLVLEHFYIKVPLPRVAVVKRVTSEKGFSRLQIMKLILITKRMQSLCLSRPGKGSDII